MSIGVTSQIIQNIHTIKSNWIQPFTLCNATAENILKRKTFGGLNTTCFPNGPQTYSNKPVGTGKGSDTQASEAELRVQKQTLNPTVPGKLNRKDSPFKTWWWI